jgi:hypothetical protein
MKNDDTARGRVRRRLPQDAARPKLPHDRDESPETGGAPRAIIAQANGDLEQGRVDTDNYTRARELTRHALRPRRRRT